MKKRTRITAKMEQKMQELRAQGKSAKEIAAVVGVSETAVRTHTTGIVVPEDEKQARVEAVRKMYTEGKTYTQIAAETGTSCVPGPQISARALLAQRQGRIKTQWE